MLHRNYCGQAGVDTFKIKDWGGGGGILVYSKMRHKATGLWTSACEVRVQHAVATLAQRRLLLYSGNTAR